MLKGWNHPEEKKYVLKAGLQTGIVTLVVLALAFAVVRVTGPGWLSGFVKDRMEEREAAREQEQQEEESAGLAEETWTETEESTEAAAFQNGFVFPDSDQRYLTREELEVLSDEELATARNELYARRGRVFTSETWGTYFNSMDWYEPTIPADSFDENTIFNEFEKANRDLIRSVEEDRK